MVVTRVIHVLELIGNTPIVKLNKLNKNQKVDIYAKLEGFNPTGSVKDRIALKMIEQAEKEGALTGEKTIIEATSGNTGIGIAMVGAVKGYKVVIVMSEGVSIERRKMLKAYGADIILTSAEEGTDGAIRKARKLVAESPEKYFMPDQFTNRYNALAHYEHTAEEIFNQMDGKIDATVWNAEETSFALNDRVKSRPLSEHVLAAIDGRDSRAALVVRGTNSITGNLLKTILDVEKIMDIQEEVISGKLLPEY